MFLCTEANRVTSGRPSCIKFGDKTDCKVAWKCVDTDRDLLARWVYLNSKTAQSTHKAVNKRSKDNTQIQQQRPESPTITLTWHACKYKVRKLHQRYILKNGCPLVALYPTFQAHLATQECTGINQNPFLFKTGHSPLISTYKHTNTHSPSLPTTIGETVFVVLSVRVVSV